MTSRPQSPDTGGDVIDGRGIPHIFWIHNAFIDAIREHQLPLVAIAVYCVLAKHVTWVRPQDDGDHERDCFLKHATIAETLGISRRQVLRGMACLEEAKLIAVKRRFVPNTVSGSKRGGLRQTHSTYVLLPINSGVRRCHSGNSQGKPDIRCDKAGVTKPTQHQQESQRTKSTTNPRINHQDNTGDGGAWSSTEARLMAVLARHGVRRNSRTKWLVTSIHRYAAAESVIDSLANELKSTPNVKNLAGLLVDALSNYEWSTAKVLTEQPQQRAFMKLEQ